MDKKEREKVQHRPAGHWQLLRDVVVFQFKLAMDGVRDVLLSPLSIGTAIYGFIASPSNPGKYFNRLLRFGHRSDRWINLFGATDHYHPDHPDDESSSDTYVRKVEEIIVNRYREGGMVKEIKDRTDGLIGRIQKDKSQDHD